MPVSTRKPRIRGEVKELQLLFEVSRALDTSMDLRDVVGPVLKLLHDHLGLTRGTLSLLNRQTGEIFVEAAHGLSASQVQRGMYKPGEGVTGRVIQTGKAAVIPRLSEDPLFLDRTQARKNLSKDDISFICVPIKLGNEVLGALSVDRPVADEVALDEDVRLVSIIASMIAQAVRLRQSAQEERERLLQDNLRLQDELKERFKPANIIGNSRAMQAVYDMIAQVSRSDTTVLIRGESGTGKELVANAIHYNSMRAGKPFIKVNCAALPETILESELFGHEKGAFTGASDRRIGRFEKAHTGTLFLDEVGEIDTHIQTKLLRVLQEGEIERVGGAETIKVDVRIVAATNRDLRDAIDKGRFREDFYYRLNVFSIEVQPLRNRRDDIPVLVDHFVRKFSIEMGREIAELDDDVFGIFLHYPWPGNVRELENVIERALVLAEDNRITRDVLPAELLVEADQAPPPPVESKAAESLIERKDRLEMELIKGALDRFRWNKTKAAEHLGLKRTTLQYKIKKYGLE